MANHSPNHLAKSNPLYRRTIHQLQQTFKDIDILNDWIQISATKLILILAFRGIFDG